MRTTFDFGAQDSPVDRLAALARAKAEIGTVLGVSRQALHKRFGKDRLKSA